MEKRQLNLNAPLLSARRYSSPSHSTELGLHKVSEKSLPPHRQQSLPVKRCEKEGLTKPAAVPFLWEQIPGRPKCQLETPPSESSNTPRLPPARRSGESPRLPPGRLSGPISRYNSGERSNDLSIYRAQPDPVLYSDHAMLLKKLNESLDESGSESGDDNAYSDAIDKLSVTESCSLNYSVSGVSDSQSGTFCIDKQTREFMMDRFLPAAKAVVIETPQYVAKKPPLHNEQLPKLLRKTVSGEIRPSSKLYNGTALPHYNRYIENVESEDDDQESKTPAKKPGKVWGILPRFSVKNTFCLSNPIPRPRPRTPPPLNELRRNTRRALSGPLDKTCQSQQESYNVSSKKKFYSGVLSRDLLGLEHKPNHESNTRNSVKSALSPLRRYRSGNLSPQRNETSKSPFRQSVVPTGAENQNANKIASSRKLFKALLDVSRNQVNERGQIGYAVEKTLYVDFVSKTEVPIKQAEDTNSLKSEELKKPSDEYVGVDNSSDIKHGTEERKLKSNDTKVSNPPQKSPLPPPLPKSPSESWLWRTLPSIPLGNPFAHSSQRNHLQSKKQGQKDLTTDTKWETIVKTSNLIHDRALCSPELKSHASYRQKL